RRRDARRPPQCHAGADLRRTTWIVDRYNIAIAPRRISGWPPATPWLTSSWCRRLSRWRRSIACRATADPPHLKRYVELVARVGDMAAVLGDGAASALGWTPVGIPEHGGYRWAIARPCGESKTWAHGRRCVLCLVELSPCSRAITVSVG